MMNEPRYRNLADLLWITEVTVAIIPGGWLRVKSGACGKLVSEFPVPIELGDDLDGD